MRILDITDETSKQSAGAPQNTSSMANGVGAFHICFYSIRKMHTKIYKILFLTVLSLS